MQLRARGYALDQSALHRYEYGRAPSLESLAALAEVYGLDFAACCVQVRDELRGRLTTHPPLRSEEAETLATAFDAWEPEKRQAFLVLAGLGHGPGGASQPQGKRQPPAPTRRARGGH